MLCWARLYIRETGRRKKRCNLNFPFLWGMVKKWSKTKSWITGTRSEYESKSEGKRKEVCKYLLKLNSNVCALVLKYSKELLACLSTHTIVFKSLLKDCKVTSYRCFYVSWIFTESHFPPLIFLLCLAGKHSTFSLSKCWLAVAPSGSLVLQTDTVGPHKCWSSRPVSLQVNLEVNTSPDTSLKCKREKQQMSLLTMICLKSEQQLVFFR